MKLPFPEWGLLLLLYAALYGGDSALGQVTFEVAAAPGASLLIDRLLSDFEKIDPSLVTVFTSGVDEETLEAALLNGRIDLAFIVNPSPELRLALKGMIFEQVATIKSQISEVRARQKVVKPADIFAIYPASPSPDVLRFLTLIMSPSAVRIFKDLDASPISAR